MRKSNSQLEFTSPPRHPQARRNLCASVPGASLPVLAFLALTAFALPAQAPTSTPGTAATPVPADSLAHKTTHHHKGSSAAHAEATAVPNAQAILTPAAPPTPEVPKWPVNEKAEDASVTWDSRGLSITASNSSLEQILKEVATATGAKVEGIEKDERIFGVYGPGVPRDVLSQLLEGSGYNVLMIGDQGQGAPRQILLSTRRSGDAQGAKSAPTPAAEEDVEVEDTNQQQPQQPVNPPFRPAFNPGQPPRPNQPNPGQPPPQPPGSQPNQ
jgi:hypothetical protein